MITDPADQQAVIDRTATSLVPGGRLIIETHNKPAVLAFHEGQRRATYLVPYPEPDTGLQTHSTLLDDDLWHCSDIWYEGGTTRIGSEMSRLTAPDEIDAYARSASLTPEHRYGDWDHAEYSEAAPMITAMYRKATP